MMTFLTIIHLIVALVLISLVLLQDSKGGGALGIGGGGSNSLLGATGAQTLAAKMTRVVAIIFAFTCLALATVTAKERKSVLDGMPAATTTAPATNPAAPATTNEAAPAQTAPAAATTTNSAPATAPAATDAPAKK